MSNERFIYKHVVIVGVDGAGRFFADADTPNIDRIFKNGACTFDMLTAEPTISAQCWGSMLLGVPPEVHKLTNGIVASSEYPPSSPFPSIFKTIREQIPDASLASFCVWNPINIGIIENSVGVFKDSWTPEEVGQIGPDAFVMNKATSYVRDVVPPTLLFIQIDEADNRGHRFGYGSPEQLLMIHRQDEKIGQLYDAYAECGAIEDTLFIVTADHGGIEYSHGGSSDQEKYVMFAAAGKSICPGVIGEMQVLDIPAVVTYALGLTPSNVWTSRVPSGLFTGVEATERPTYTPPKSTRASTSFPTPKNDVTNVIKDKKLKAYFPFDSSIADRLGSKAEQSGKLYFIDGYFDKGLSLDDGYVSIKDLSLGKESFGICFWLKTSGLKGDPAVISNKDWRSGANAGFVLSVRENGDIIFNVGNGEKRADTCKLLPYDYDQGWVFVALSLDRKAGTVGISCDFGEFSSYKLPTELMDLSLDTEMPINIGQDGTGNYPAHLSATIDELMIFDGALAAKDIADLAKHYGVK